MTMKLTKIGYTTYVIVQNNRTLFAIRTFPLCEQKFNLEPRIHGT